MSGVGNKGDKKPAVQAADINLKFKWQDGSEVFFKVKRNTKLTKLMVAYSDRRSVDLNSIAFLYKGRQLHGDQTPEELEMKDGDQIDAKLRQTVN